MIQAIGGMSVGAMPMPSMRMQPPDPEEMFDKLDSDGDGALSETELQAMTDHLAEKLGDEAPSAADLLAKLDEDGDGALSFAEFEAGRPQGPPPGGPLGQMPPGAGRDQSGQVSLEELFNSSEDDEDALYPDLYAYA